MIGDDFMRVMEVVADPKRLAACRREVAALAKKMNEVEAKATNTGTALVDGGRFKSLRTANLTLSDGIYIVNPATGYPTTKIEPTGEVYHGYNVDRHEGLSMGIWANRLKWNGETMEAGDVLMGDNSTNAANLKWNRVLKRLEFRGGQTVQAWVDTLGEIVAGGGSVYLNSSGIVVQGDRIIFKDAPGTNTAGSIGGTAPGDGYYSAHVGVTLLANDATNSRMVEMVADSARAGDKPAGISVESYNGGKVWLMADIGAVELTKKELFVGANLGNMIDLKVNGPIKVVSNLVELDEIAAPGAPDANKIRIYCRDVGGTSRLCYQDSAGAETIVT